MAAIAAVARANYARQQRIVQRAAQRMQSLWLTVDPGDLSGSWAAQLPAAVRLLTAAQLASAAAATGYVEGALATQEVTPDLAGTVVPAAFAGIAADGRDLASLLTLPLIDVKSRIALGQPLRPALLSGLSALLLYTKTETADAGRAATGVAMTADRAVTGWVRQVGASACSRCIVLAGKVFRLEASASFLRHPRCGCTAVPLGTVADRSPLDFDPKARFDAMTAAEQDHTFTKAGAQAIRDGADISQVVNARRGALGLSVPGARLTREEVRMLRGGRDRGHLARQRVFGHDLFTTTEGTTRRGVAGKRLGAWEDSVKLPGERYRRARAPRLMPESIYEIVDGDRDEAIRLLKRFGYIR